MIRAQNDNGDSFGEATDMARAAVLAEINAGTTFLTILAGSDGKMFKGQTVPTFVDSRGLLRPLKFDVEFPAEP